MARSISVKELAEGGQYIFYAIATTELVVVLLVAPAATAGAICLDRARGNLTHMLATELTSSEIVLGKLAARLLPVAALVMATIPVLALAGLLGGVIFEAIVSLTLITLAVAIFGCALALAISVRATKAHEVLMAVYAVESIWILSPLVAFVFGSARAPTWLAAINPFVLAWAPHAWPGYAGWGWVAGVLAGIMTISAGLAGYAVLRVRAEATREGASSVSRMAAWLGRMHGLLFWWRPAPSLDKDPVLWREWRRGASVAIGADRLGSLHCALDRRPSLRDRGDCGRRREWQRYSHCGQRHACDIWLSFGQPVRADGARGRASPWQPRRPFDDTTAH